MASFAGLWRRGRAARFGFAHRWPVEIEAVGVVDEAVEDGIGEGRLADHLVPGLYGELAGDQRRARAVAVFDDLHQVAALTGGKAIRAPVVEDQETGTRKLAE